MNESRYRLPTVLVLAALLAGAASAVAQEIKVNPGSIEFGRVTGAKTRAVKIQNKGSADLMVGPIVRCSGTSVEFTFTPADAQVPARRSTDLAVTYTPADAGADEGCLEIPSNDPSTPVFRLRLRGSGVRADGGELRLRPSSIDFGQVAIGDVATRSFLIQVTGGAALDATIVACAGTSPEFTPGAAQVTVGPGRGASVDVAYSPIDAGPDAGCVEIQRLDGAQGPLTVRLAGSGSDQVPPAGVVDLDIHDFKVRRESRLKAAQPVNIRLWVKNVGSVAGPAPATVVGSQNGAVVYTQTRSVSDRPGNEGVSKFDFPPFTPTAPGDVVWTATIDDGDPDVDTATAVTRVLEQPGSSTGVDLDVRRFRVTRALSLADGGVVRLRLAVWNNGDVDEARPATLIGMQDGVEVYNQTLAVSDPPGDRGSTNYRFPAFTPAAPGEIVWMLVIVDDDPDADEAFAVTRVAP